jgi:hypothetical protein
MEADFHQSGSVFFLAHMHACGYSSGVPTSAVPDSMAAVLRARRNEPQLNPSYCRYQEGAEIASSIHARALRALSRRAIGHGRYRTRNTTNPISSRPTT